MHESLKKQLNHFLIGVFAIIPIVIVLQIIIFVKGLISELFRAVSVFSDSNVYTALIFIISFALLTWIGNTIAQKGGSFIIRAFDIVIERIPLLNTVYRVMKKVINMFLSHDESIAKEVVYVEYPKEGVWVPAYVTNRQDSKYILFIPTSPNPTSGFTVIVDKSRVVVSEMDIEDATSFIVSVGVDFNKSFEARNLP
jgi:uncharacterized membrane protein